MILKLYELYDFDWYRYLDEILKKDTIVRKQDSPRVFKSVANNPAGHSIAFTYLRSNWIKLND